MFIWGGLLLLAFLTPTAIDPDLAFHWNTIIDGEGKAKIPPLLMAAAGLLGILLAIIPTSPPPRGLMAGLLGLVGFALPPILALSQGDFGLDQILTMTYLVGLLLLVPGLLIRNEYRESILPRLFVTFGVLCVLALYLVPVNGNLGIVRIFEGIIDGEGKAKIGAIIGLVPLIYAVISLLAWLPSPSTGAGKVMAWLWITLFPLQELTSLLLMGHIGDRVKGKPFEALMEWAPTSAYLVLLAYGFATVIGKKLE